MRKGRFSSTLGRKSTTMRSRFTYSKLFETLKALGYVEQSSGSTGTRQLIFRHPDYPRATIYLPLTSPNDRVTAMHLAAVRAVLTNHGVVRINSDEAFLQAIGADNENS
jgi:hypothetical protein